MSLAILFHFLCAQHVSDINISIIRSLRLFLLNYHIGRIVLGLMCWSFGVVGLEWICVAGFSQQHGYLKPMTIVVIQQKKSQALDDGYINVQNMWST